MSHPHRNRPGASKNLFAALSPESPHPQYQPDASKGDGTSLPQEPGSTSHQEPLSFTRAPPGDFGDRLAMARRARPNDVPPAPPRAAPPVPAALTFAFDGPPSTPATAPGPSHPITAYKPRYGSQPGSYTSPYDIGGKTPGDPRLSTNSVTWAEFEAKHGSSSHSTAARSRSWKNAASEHTMTPGPSREGASLGTIPFGEMPPVETKGERKAPAATVSEQKVLPAIPEGAEPRLLWLGPYYMVRHVCERKRDLDVCKILGKWFEENMPTALMTAVHRDLMLPEIVYAVNIPMTTEYWDRYHQLLKLFSEAHDLNDQLNKGYFALDNFTATHLSAAGEATWLQLTEEGKSMEERLEQLVAAWDLGRPWDTGRGSANRPELWPVEMGGTLRDYPLDR